MKKNILHLLTLVSMMLVCGVNPIWADDPVATGTVGLTQTIDEDAKKIGPNKLSGLSDAAGEIDYITIGKPVYGKNISNYAGTSKTVYLNSTAYNTTDSWRKSMGGIYDEQYVGYDLGINADYQVNLKKLNARILIANDTYTWYVEVLNASDQQIYKSEEKTTTTASTASISDDLTAVEGLTGLTGSIKVRLWVKQGGSYKYFTIDRLTLDLDVMPDTRTRYTVRTSVIPEGAGTVSPSGETKFIVGSNVTLTATAKTGYKFTSWTINGSVITENPYTIENIKENKSVTANFEALPKIQFSNGDDATIKGSAPTEYFEVGSSYTLPGSYYFTKEGYTFSKWTDGVNNYNIGDNVTVYGDMTFTPVFTENETTLKSGNSTITWPLATSLGAPLLSCEGSTMYYVQQATIGGKTIDVAMFINTEKNAGISGSQGKLNNTSNASYSQVNGGTVFKIPAFNKTTITITYVVGTPDVTAYKFNGANADDVNTTNKTITYTYQGTEPTVQFIDQGRSLYPSLITVVYEPKTDATTPTYMTGKFNFERKAYPVTFTAVAGEKLMVSVDGATAVEMASPATVYPKANASAYATAEGLNNSGSTNVDVPNTYDDAKPYVAWVHTSTYNAFASNYTGDKILTALKSDYNVVLVDYAPADTPSEDLKYANLIVSTECMSGGQTFSNGMQNFAGVTPMINLKFFNYTSGRWSWGTPANPGKAIVGFTPKGKYKVFKGVTYESDGSISVYNTGSGDFNSENNHIQTVTFNENAPASNVILGEAASQVAVHCADKFFGIGLSSDNAIAYSQNAAIIICNAAEMLIAGEKLDAQAHTLTTTDNNFYGLYLDYDAVIPKEIEAYTGDLNAEETTLTLNKVEQTTLPKNTAVVVRSKESTGNFTFDFASESSSALLATNSLQGVTEETAFTALAETGKTVLTLGIKDGVVAFRKPAAATLKANRVYLQVTTPSEGSSPKRVSMVINDGETNGITEVRAEKADSNTPLYNLAGQRVNAGAKGLLIKNGKKYIPQIRNRPHKMTQRSKR